MPNESNGIPSIPWVPSAVKYVTGVERGKIYKSSHNWYKRCFSLMTKVTRLLY